MSHAINQHCLKIKLPDALLVGSKGAGGATGRSGQGSETRAEALCSVALLVDASKGNRSGGSTPCLLLIQLGSTQRVAPDPFASDTGC